MKNRFLLLLTIIAFGSAILGTNLLYAQPCSTTSSWAVFDNDVYLLNTGVTPFTQTAYNNVLPGATQANAFVSSTGFMYSVTTAASPTLYRYNTASPATLAVNTGFALPTVNATNAGTDVRYQSGGQDADGNVYFATNNGRLMVKIDPVSGTTTTIWSPSNPLTTVGPDFYSGGSKNFVVDGNGDFVFIDAVSRILYTVPKTGGTATARGAVSGLPGGYDATDLFFANGNMYVSSGSSTGSYPINMSTLAAGSVAGAFVYQEVSTGSCAALIFPPLAADLCPTNTLYATNADGSAINTLNASTYAVVSTRSPITNTFSISLNGADGKLYYATNASGATNPPLYVFDPVTNLTYPSGCTLPTLASGRYYISAGSDGAGSLYFTTEHGQAAYRINPATCTVTTMWNDASPVINDPQRPSSINFTTDYKDMVTDAAGNLIFVDDTAPYSVWVVNPTTRQSTYRGNLTGVSGMIGDVFFKDGNLFVATASNGIYQINSSTFAGTAVSSYNSSEVATAPCEAGTLPALEGPDGCVTNVIYTATNNIQQVNATTFAPIRTYALPISNVSIAFASNGYIYTVTSALNPTNPVIYGLNPSTGAVFATTCTLPSLTGGRYYISGASDAEGNIYFSSDHGDILVKVNPGTCARETVWNTTLTSSGAPAGVTFNQDYKDLTIDGNGDYYFVDDLNHHVWQVKKGTTTAIYRGKITGVGTRTISDLVFIGPNVYVTTGTSSSTGVFQLNPDTYVATQVASYTYYDAASAPCTALPLGLQISGNILNDGNGNTDNTVSTNGTGALTPVNGTSLDGTPLYVTLVNSSNTALATVPVLADGKYSFPSVVPGTYSVVLSTNPAGTTSADSPLPAGWDNSGEQLGTTNGGADGTPNGVLGNIVVSTANVANANFGINKAPTANPGTVASTTNPGGSTSVPVTGSFGGTDPEGGAITSLTITSFPSNATSITIGGTTYTTGGGGGTTAWPGTVTVLTNASGVPSSAISVDPINGATTVGIPFRVTDNTGLTSPIATLNVPFAATFSIAGSIFNDNDGTTGNANGDPVNGSSSGTNPLNLVVNLYDAAGNFVTSAPVLADGTYSLSGVPAGDGYQVQLNTADNVGQSGENITDNSNADLTGNFVHVSGSDGVTPTDGINVLDINANVTASNFGINEGPTANPGTIASTTNPGGTNSVPVTGSFGGTDPNGGAITSLTITNFPTGTTSITIGGTTYTAPGGGGANEWTGPVSVPTSSTGVPTTGNEISVDPADGNTTVAIQFTVTDNAGLTSSGGTLNVPFSAPVTYSIAGSIFNDNDGTTGNANGDPVNGSSSGTNPLNLVINLYDAAGNFVTSAPVLADGTYSLSGVPAGDGYQVQLNTADNMGQNGENITDNSNADLTGNFVHVSSSDGVTPTDGINVLDINANVTGSNFGINEGPTADPGIIASTTNPGATTSVPVTGSFGGTDPNGGAITSLTITNFPTGATSITIGATAYTAPGSGGANEWTGPVSVPTSSTGVPTTGNEISVDPADGNTTVAIQFTVTDNAGLTSSGGTLNVPFSAPVTYSIAGSIFNDNDGTTNAADGDPVNGSNSGTDPLDLVVNLYDAAGNFVTSAPVLADGSYSLSGVPAGNGYQVQLNTAANVGQNGENISANSNADLTGNFVHVSGSDGVTPTDGINVLDINANVTASNFGINEGPTANPGTIASTTNPGATTSVPVTGSFGGTDPNDGAITSLTITNFPTGATSITIGGITYTAPGGGGANEWTGPVTVPTNTTGVPTTGNEISVDPADGNTTVAIQFTVTDNAGLTSSAGTLNVPFAAPAYAVSGTIYNDANGQTGGANGSLFNGSTTQLFVNLYDAAGTFIASAPVDANGAYTLTGVGVGTGYQAQVSSVQATGGTLSPNAALPGTYENVSSNGETGSHTDGIIQFDIAAGDVPGVDFGIQRPPVADVVTNDPTTSSAYSATPPTGFPIVSGFLSIPYSDLNAFSGTDPEDPSVLVTGNTVKIGTVNPNTKVYYDFPDGGAREVAENEDIPNFDPAKLVFYGQIGSGSTSTPFGLTYSVRDAAGVFSAPSEYIFSTGGDPLPVKLSSFTAKKGEGQTAVLDWTTTAETNSEKFNVEHSTDAKSWNVITVMVAKGESKELAHYNYKHTNPVAGQNLYRLKMADLDGTFAYSRIVSLSFDDVAKATFYPNPAADKVKVKLEGATTGDVTKITLFALDGKVAYTANKLIQGEIDVNYLQAGAYVVTIILRNGTTQNSKIVIVK